MKNLNRILLAALSTMMLATPLVVSAEAVSLEQLLEQTRQGRATDNQVNAQRIADFRANRAQQAKLLQDGKSLRRQAEARSARMEKEFEANDQEIIELDLQLQERLGDLKELFGVLQQASGDAIGQFEGSLTQVQYPDRTQFLTEFAQKMGESNRLASLEEIERLHFEFLREMTESGRTVKFTTEIVAASGEKEQREVTRVGLFNIVSKGNYLDYRISDEGNLLVELPRQPAKRYTSKIPELESATSGLHAFAVDPLRGQLVAMLKEAPNLQERVAQGKEIGYIIIALGILAFLVAIYRLFALAGTSAKVRSQMKNPDNPGNNPLGRVLSTYSENKSASVETLELKMGEAILKETPKLNSMQTFLKIIAAVAPLMGLLGTVTGMINTFQQITLFGTGDPKLMAGGISQALVTTVLGLVVAIPTLFMHTLVSSRSKHIIQVLQEQAAGIIARQAEGRG